MIETNAENSEQSSPGLSLSKLSKHTPRMSEPNGCGKKFVKIIFVKLTYDQSQNISRHSV